MNTKEFENEKTELFYEALRYAYKIVPVSGSYLEYAATMYDYFGEAILPLCKEVYYCLYKENVLDASFFENRVSVIESVTDYEIRSECHKFNDSHKKYHEFDKYDKLVDSGLIKPEMLKYIRPVRWTLEDYRGREGFMQTLELMAAMPKISAFNAYMAQTQRPGVKVVLTQKEWFNKHMRFVKNDATPIILLQDFGPIMHCFEFKDTIKYDGSDDAPDEEDKILESYGKKVNKQTGELDSEVLQNLCDNLPQYGIFLDDRYIARNAQGATLYAQKENSITLCADIEKIVYITHNSLFRLHVNLAEDADTSTRFRVICHELALLFCRHIRYEWEKTSRGSSAKEKEFEAEVVTWLVCKRLGMETVSDSYILESENKFPYLDMNVVCKAANKISGMTVSKVKVYEKWVKHDKQLAEKIKNAC